MNCKICENKTKSFFDTQLQKTYNHCETCQLITLEPSFEVTLDREKAQYENHQNSLDNLGYVQMFEDFLNLFWNTLTCKEIHALDFGSGPTPVLSQLLQKRGALVECYDKFYQPKTIFEDKSYDLITSTEVFEHLGDPLSTLKLLTKHLKPNGILAIMTLLHTNEIDTFLTWWYRRDPTHITFYTLKTLVLLGEKCGLDVIETDERRIVVFKKR